MVFNVITDTHMNTVFCAFKGEEDFRFNQEIKTVHVSRQI